MGKLSKYKYLLFIIFLLASALLGVVISKISVDTLAERQFAVYGIKTRDMALLMANSYYITDAEVEELAAMDFKDVINHPANKRLTALFANELWETDIKYAYIMKLIPPEQLKYNVTEENADFYQTEVGTPLNAVYLVNVVLGESYGEIMARDPNYYNDINRYSYFREADAKAYRERKVTYLLTEDEYGNVISGVVPFFSEEGTFVGMLGVDIYTDAYEAEVAQISSILTYTFFIPTIGLTAVFIILYIKSKRDMLSDVYTDSLMRIKNRKFIDKYIPQIVKEHHEKKRPLAVIMIDVDCFKNFNDTYGHQQGDEALIKVANAAGSVLRTQGDYICRYGGEEILIVLTNTDENGAWIVAQRIKEAVMAVNLPHEASTAAEIVTVSQGVYSAVPNGANAAAAFIGNADKGLYEAKKTGRNKFVLFNG